MRHTPQKAENSVPPVSSKRRGTISLSVQDKKLKIDFQDGHHGGHLVFPIGTILAIFDPQCFLLSFKSTGFWGWEKKRKKNFQDGHHGGHLDFQSAGF